MAKKTTPTIDINIDDINIEEIATDEIAEEVIIVADEKPKANAKSVIDEIKRNAPEFPVWDNMTPKDLDSLFLMGDQGRTIRRYLRKYFSDNHIHKSGWSLTKSEANAVIAYLATKFGTPNFDNINKDEEAQA